MMLRVPEIVADLVHDDDVALPDRERDLVDS